MGSSEGDIQYRVFLPSEEPNLYSEMKELRHQVLRVPIGLSLYDEDLSQETGDYCFVALSSGELVGCLMLSPAPEHPGELNLRQMAVKPSFQGRKIGKHLVEYAEAFAKSKGMRRISLNGRTPAVPFYRRVGYEFVSDTEFRLKGIPHYALHKLLN